MYEATRAAGFGDEVKRRIMLGTYALSSGYYEAYYGRAQRVRTKIADDFRAAFDRFDFVVTPTSPSVAFELGAKLDDPWSMYMSDYFTVPMPLAGIPAVSIPAGLAEPDGEAPGSRSGSRSPGRRSARTRCSTRRSRSSRQSASTPAHPESGDHDEPEGNGYEAVIGLEIHVQLSTRTKMFCGCELSFGDEPNIHTCPVCLGHPGTLPVTNERAIQFALMIARAFECEVVARSIFHRKNYFYPDLPKGYQISQYDIPLAGGRLGDVRINRVHLEEDAAKLIHLGESGRIHGSGQSLVDFNRGGTPLVEIVTDLTGAAAEAREWLLRTTIKQLGVSDVNMEEGAPRRERLAAPGGVRGSRCEDRAQEHEQLPLPRARDRGRARTPGGTARGRRAGNPGHVALRSQDRIAYAAAKQGVRARLPVLPEPDLVPLAPTEEMLPRAGAAGLRAAARPVPRRARAVRRSRHPARVRGRAGELLRVGGLRRVRRGDARRDRELGHRRARGRAAPGGRGGSSFVEGRASGAGDARRNGAGEAGHARRRSRCSRHSSPTAAIRLARREASARSPTRASSRLRSTARSRPIRTRRAVREGNAKAIGPIVGEVMKETKGRADGGEVTS